MVASVLSHWGRVTHICASKLTGIGSDNGLSPGRRQAIIWTNDGILLSWPWWTNFSEILIRIQTFSFKKMHLKMSSAKWRPFCLGLIVLMKWSREIWRAMSSTTAKHDNAKFMSTSCVRNVIMVYQANVKYLRYIVRQAKSGIRNTISFKAPLLNLCLLRCDNTEKRPAFVILCEGIQPMQRLYVFLLVRTHCWTNRRFTEFEYPMSNIECPANSTFQFYMVEDGV